MSETRVHDQVHTWARDLIDLAKRNNARCVSQLAQSTLRLVDPAPAAYVEAEMLEESL